MLRKLFDKVSIGRIRTVELNGETVSESGWCLSLHRRWWTLYYRHNEAGCRVIQIGPFILEIWSNVIYYLYH